MHKMFIDDINDILHQNSLFCNANSKFSSKTFSIKVIFDAVENSTTNS